MERCGFGAVGVSRGGAKRAGRALAWLGAKESGFGAAGGVVSGGGECIVRGRGRGWSVREGTATAISGAAIRLKCVGSCKRIEIEL